jgi:hypothetical protein
MTYAASLLIALLIFATPCIAATKTLPIPRHKPAIEGCASQPPVPSDGKDGSPQKPHPSDATGDAQTDKRGTSELPLIVSPTQEEAKQISNDRLEKSANDRHLVWLTAILASGTIILAVATSFLWLSTRRLVKDADNTAKRQLRAYVNVVIDTNISMVLDSNNLRPKRDVYIKNFGKTPAHEVTIVGNFVIGDYELKECLPKLEWEGHGSKVVIHPGHEQLCTLRAKTAFTEDEYGLFSDRKKNMYFYGRIEYKDAFGDPRWTIFRLRTIPTGVGVSQWISCSEGNDAN